MGKLFHTGSIPGLILPRRGPGLMFARSWGCWQLVSPLCNSIRLWINPPDILFTSQPRQEALFHVPDDWPDRGDPSWGV